MQVTKAIYGIYFLNYVIQFDSFLKDKARTVIFTVMKHKYAYHVYMYDMH